MGTSVKNGPNSNEVVRVTRDAAALKRVRDSDGSKSSSGPGTLAARLLLVKLVVDGPPLTVQEF